MTILHVDLNSYFASLEQQQNPRLRGKPVGIVKDLGRACIIAASREAKQLGIKTGTSVFEAKASCPRLILVKADFAKYFHYTQRFWSLIQSFTPRAHLFSLDEAFLDATDSLRLYGSAEALAVRIQEGIYRELGSWVTASVGIGQNFLLAKLATEYASAGGYFRITAENRDAILGRCPPIAVCGIGPRLAEKLRDSGITNLLEIRRLPEVILRRRFGPFWATELRRIAWGNDSHLFSFLDTRERMRGVGRTLTGFHPCDNERIIRQTIRNLIEETTAKIRKMKMAGRHVAIFLEGDQKVWYRHRTLAYYVRHPDEVFDLLYNGFYRNWQRRFSIIRFGVRIDLLEPLDKISSCWLPQWTKRERLWQAMDTINDKYGLLSVRPATLLGFRLIRPEVTGYFGDKLYHLMEVERGTAPGESLGGIPAVDCQRPADYGR